MGLIPLQNSPATGKNSGALFLNMSGWGELLGRSANFYRLRVRVLLNRTQIVGCSELAATISWVSDRPATLTGDEPNRAGSQSGTFRCWCRGPVLAHKEGSGSKRESWSWPKASAR